MDSNPLPSFLDRIVERMGCYARANVVFAEPIERDGITVIPVARARWGFGGGLGMGQAAQGGETGTDAGSGSRLGGGGGLALSPVGYIEIKDGAARFRPIYDPGALASAALAGAIMTLTLVLALRKRS